MMTLTWENFLLNESLLCFWFEKKKLLFKLAKTGNEHEI